MIPVQIVERVSITIATAMCPFLVKRFGKKKLVMTGAAIMMLGQLIMLDADRSPGILSLAFLVLADTHFGGMARQDGMIYSAGSIGAKLGGGLAGATVGIILNAIGYDGMASVQSASAIFGIRLAFILPALSAPSCHYWYLSRIRWISSIPNMKWSSASAR